MNSNAVIAKNLFQEDLYQLPSRIIVIISKPWEATSENDRTVLSKMLVAVRLNLATVQIVERVELTLDDLKRLSPSKVLIFGAQFTPAIKPYEFNTPGGIPVIVADSLEQLDDLKKKNLWTALKQMFAL